MIKIKSCYDCKFGLAQEGYDQQWGRLTFYSFCKLCHSTLNHNCEYYKEGQREVKYLTEEEKKDLPEWLK